MTKTHHDLDGILQLLQEKEKDLELAASIGKALLERNKSLLTRTENLESYMLHASERETQLRHEVSMKSELLRQFVREEESDEGSGGSLYSSFDEDTRSDNSCKDESILNLQTKCKKLEEHNSQLIFEALKLKEETASVEQKEYQLVNDCVHQLGEAKQQISLLTEEISAKAEDNIRQQDEITHLIATVVELQRKHKELSHENVELHNMLDSSKSNQCDLKDQISTLFDKYEECFQILQENQREMKHLKSKVESSSAKVVRPKDGDLAHGGRTFSAKDSLAEEIEEHVRKGLLTSQEKREHTSRVMETVRAANASKKSPTLRRSGRYTRPRQPSKGPEDMPEAFKGEEEKRFARVSSQTDFGTDATSPVGSPSSYGRYPRGMHLPERLQIVKPIEGSQTLHKWQQLASPNLSGLSDERPGVHVKGEPEPGKEEDHEEKPDVNSEDEMYEEDEPIMMKIRSDPRTTSSQRGPSSHTTTTTTTVNTTSVVTTSAKTRAAPGTGRSKLTSLICKQGIQAAPVPLLTTTAITTPALSTREAPRKMLATTTGTDIFSKFLKVTTSGLIGMAGTQPITTVASSSITTSTFSPSGKGLSRSLSSENFLARYPSADNELGVGTGLMKRSSSGSSLQRLESTTHGLSQEEFGGSQPLQRRKSHGSLTDLVKAFDFVSTVKTNETSSSSLSTLRSSLSMESPEEEQRERRASFTMGESPPSPTSLEHSGLRRFFGFPSTKPSSSIKDPSSSLSEQTQATLSKFDLPRGSLRRTRSLEGASSNIPETTKLPQQQLTTDAKQEQMKTIKRVMKHDGFGGLGLM